MQGEDEDEMDKVTTLFINNLPSHVVDDQLKALFTPYLLYCFFIIIYFIFNFYFIILKYEKD